MKRHLKGSLLTGLCALGLWNILERPAKGQFCSPLCCIFGLFLGESSSSGDSVRLALCGSETTLTFLLLMSPVCILANRLNFKIFLKKWRKPNWRRGHSLNSIGIALLFCKRDRLWACSRNRCRSFGGSLCHRLHL